MCQAPFPPNSGTTLPDCRRHRSAAAVPPPCGRDIAGDRRRDQAGTARRPVERQNVLLAVASPAVEGPVREYAKSYARSFASSTYVYRIRVQTFFTRIQNKAATVGRSHADGLVLCTKRCGYRRKENKVQLWIFNYGLFDQAMKLGFTSCRSWRCLRRSASAPRRRPPAAAVRRSGRLPSPRRTG